MQGLYAYNVLQNKIRNMTPGLEKAQDRARLVTIKLLYKSFGFFFTLALNIFINKNEYIKLLDKLFLKVVNLSILLKQTVISYLQRICWEKKQPFLLHLYGGISLPLVCKLFFY